MKYSKFTTGLSKCLIVCILLASILSLLSKFSVVFSILSIFNTYYFIVAIFLTAFSFFHIKNKLFLYLSLVSIIINLLVLVPYVSGNKEETTSPNSISVLSINVSESTDAYGELIEYLETNEVDLVLIQELRQDLIDLIEEKLSEKYPYTYFEPSRFTLGLGFVSKIPLEDGKTINFESNSFGRKYIQAKLSKNGNEYKFINVHPLPPVRPGWFNQKNTEIKKYLEIINNNDTYIVSGDFNTNPWSYPISQLPKNQIVKNLVFNSSWQIFSGLIKIPYDYAIFSKNIEVKNYKTLSTFRSDHLPIRYEVNSIQI